MRGSPLVMGRDAGGTRWFLAGEPVHAGTGLELLIDNGKGQDWLVVRLEFDYARHRAFAYLPSVGARMHAEVSEGARFRWPVRAHGSIES